MAEGKRSFAAYCDWIHTFEELPDDKAGQLVKHLFRYVNDLNPETDDIIIRVAFSQIKTTLKRDLKKWEQKREINRINGSKGGKQKVANASKRKRTLAKGSERVANLADSVSDSVIVYNNKGFADEIVKNKHEHQSYIEGLYMRHKIKNGELGKLLSGYNLDLQVHEVNHKTLSEYKKHFANWLNKQEQLNKLQPHKV